MPSLPAALELVLTVRQYMIISRVCVMSAISSLTLASLTSNEQLRRSPAFNRGVHDLHRRFQRLKNGLPPEEMGGTNRDPRGQQSPLPVTSSRVF